MENVGPIGPLKGPNPIQPPKAEPAEGERSFKEILQDSIDRVNNLQKEADLMVEKFARGEANEDELMVSFKKAQLAFETLMQIRNKLVDAFEEIQRMRI